MKDIYRDSTSRYSMEVLQSEIRMRVNPVIIEFLDDEVPLLRDTRGKDIVSRALLFNLVTETRGTLLRTSMRDIKRQITLGMNNRYERWSSKGRGVKGGAWYLTKPKIPEITNNPT